METYNLWRILNDCEKYGDMPQTFSGKVVKAAIRELQAIEAAQQPASTLPDSIKEALNSGDGTYRP